LHWQHQERHDMITRAPVHSLATLGPQAWAAMCLSSLVVWCLGCNVFGELFPLFVPLVLVGSQTKCFLQQHPTNCLREISMRAKLLGFETRRMMLVERRCLCTSQIQAQAMPMHIWKDNVANCFKARLNNWCRLQSDP